MVRAASADDLAEVAALEQRCFADPWPRSAFASLPENPHAYFAVARGVDGSFAGYVVGWHVLNEAEVANLAVDPAARGRGVGGCLLDALLADADARAVERVFLEVRESNRSALRLYESRAFSVVGRRKNYYRQPREDALILRRERLAAPSASGRNAATETSDGQ